MTAATRPRTLIIAGGGTGGHVLAGVALAEEWQRRGLGPVRFVGARGGIEERLVPRAGHALFVLRLGALKGGSLASRLRTLALLPLACVRSLVICLREQPSAIVGVGGYASGPLVLVGATLARLLKVLSLGRIRLPVAILEQNAAAGLTNRWLGRIATRVFLAFPGLESAFGVAKSQISGNPIRSALAPMPPASRRPFVVFVFGGSQGAQGINSLVLEALPLLDDVQGQIEWIHQTGERDFERVVAEYARLGVRARVERFIYDMPECYRKASLLICRAGSSTLSEVAAVGRAAVLVPYPHASDDHQTKNAQVYVGAGAARLLKQSEANGLDLARMIRADLADDGAIVAMEQRVRVFYRPRACEDVVDYLIGEV